MPPRSNRKHHTKRSWDSVKLKKNFRVFIICCCVIFLVAVLGSFFAIRQHNQTVTLIKQDHLKTNGTVIPSSNSKVIKTNFEFEYNGQKYTGSTFDNYGFSEGAEICIDFYKNDPSESVYCHENKIIEMNYVLYATKIVGAFIILLFSIFFWSFITGNKRLMVESTSRKKK